MDIIIIYVNYLRGNNAEPRCTADNIYHSLPAEFEVGGAGVALDLQDTGGSYTQDFPAMVQLSLQSADAVILGNIATSGLVMV